MQQRDFPDGPVGIADSREATRANMFLAAILYAEGAPHSVKIRDMSVSGAQLEGSELPQIGSAVTLARGSLSVQGRVTWRTARRCGVQFGSRVAVRDWMAPTGNREQRRVDHVVSAIKAGVIPLMVSASHQQPTPSQIAEDLRRVSSLLQSLANALGSDCAVVRKHGNNLQNIDIAYQSIAALADAVEAELLATPEISSRLEDLRLSCEEALRLLPAQNGTTV
ncbi:MAG TPA: PilZ domain-containing protein [Sphingomicrobium sp.]|nr:PilZ domain-containing protein [Sphingomicrobium sp.]